MHSNAMDITLLYREYRDRVFGYLYSRVQNRHTAEDLCQDVFLKAVRSADSYDGTKASVSTWIYTITRNTLTDYYRSRRVEEELPMTLTDGEDAEEKAVQAEDLEHLAKALAKMDEKLRDVIVLHYYDGRTLRDVAQTMGLSYSYVKVLRDKALDFLKKDLKNG